MKYFLFITFLAFHGLSMSANAQQGFNIMVSLNGSEAGSVYQDQPMIIRVVLVNRQAQSAANWNQAAERRLEELDQLKASGKLSDSLYETEKEYVRSQMRVQNISTIGSPSQPWTGMVKWTIRSPDGARTFDWPLKLLTKPKPRPVAVMDANAFYMGYYAMDPEMMNQVPAGNYLVEARIGNVVSGSLRVAVDRKTKVSENLDHLILLAKYYWHKADGDRSLTFSEMILARNPRHISGLMLKADALYLKRSFLPALEVYNLALQEYYTLAGVHAEPPDYILEMISAIKLELDGN